MADLTNNQQAIFEAERTRALDGIDAWLTTDRDAERVAAHDAPPHTDDDAPVAYRLRTPLCSRCGDEGCRFCEGDRGDDAYDEEYALGQMEDTYERYIGRS